MWYMGSQSADISSSTAASSSNHLCCTFLMVVFMDEIYSTQEWGVEFSGGPLDSIMGDCYCVYTIWVDRKMY